MNDDPDHLSPEHLTVDFEDVNAQGVRFLRSELELGLTFCQIALERASSPAKTERNRVNARTAYDTAQRFLPRMTLTAEEQEEISSRFALLREQLIALGESV